MSDSKRQTYDGTKVNSHYATTPVLLYDAKYEMCNELAYKVRAYADKPLRLVALSDPEADELLERFHPNGWSEDFYLVDGSSCRKGVRALPKLIRIVGVRDFCSLANDYAQWQQQSEDCDHENHETQNSQKAKNNTSRRSFAKAMSAAAVPLAAPVGVVAGASEPKSFENRPPSGLQARVARIRPDGDGFDVTVEREPELVRQETWRDDEMVTTQTKKKPAKMEARDHTTLHDVDSLLIQRAEVDVVPESPNANLASAFQQSGPDSSDTGELIRHGVIDDQSRFGFSFNLGHGPMTVDGDPSVESTLSGQVSHDLPEKTVDFLKFESEREEDLSTHLNAYIAGMRGLQQYYSENSNQKMEVLYGQMATRLETISPKLVESIGNDHAPLENVVGISSVPYWNRYVESPTTESEDLHQSVTTQGTSCECGCCGLSCCTDCGCGCSICLGTEPGCGCGCCIIGCGGGCGCGCCICA